MAQKKVEGGSGRDNVILLSGWSCALITDDLTDGVKNPKKLSRNNNIRMTPNQRRVFQMTR